LDKFEERLSDGVAFALLLAAASPWDFRFRLLAVPVTFPSAFKNSPHALSTI